ncbi:MAG TPA: phasin family protein [Microvirga sp.]|jgi:DNA repair exonuclease SbcCD ATPase subunit
MTTIRQLIQSSPARANELFAKLVDTSETAVKTRERLFAELKEELELFTSLEEQHLFPVLRKHKELKELVREALSDNKATRKLLTELDHTPKDSEEFATRVAELRRVFQQHVRDEKKELLPAVLKALSDGEAEAVVEGFEAGKAEIEEAKRAEAEDRRAEARRERERAEAEQMRLEEARRAEAAARREAARQEREETERLQKAAEAVVTTAWAAPRTAEQTVRSAQEAVRNAVSTTSEVAQQTSEQVAQVLDATRERTQALTDRVSQRLQAATQTGTTLARRFQDTSDAYLDMVQSRMQMNLAGLDALTRCRTPAEFLAAQSSLMRSNMDLTLANTRRVAEIAAGLAGQATQAVTSAAGRSDSRTA